MKQTIHPIWLAITFTSRIVTVKTTSTAWKVSKYRVIRTEYRKIQINIVTYKKTSAKEYNEVSNKKTKWNCSSWLYSWRCYRCLRKLKYNKELLIKISLPKKIPDKIQFQEWCEWKKQLMKQTKKYFWQNAQHFFYTLSWSPFNEKK